MAGAFLRNGSIVSAAMGRTEGFYTAGLPDRENIRHWKNCMYREDELKG